MDMEGNQREQIESFDSSLWLDGPENLPFLEWDARLKSGHCVQFYADDAFLVESVAAFIGEGILNGSGGIIIATKSHQIELQRQFQARGIDLDEALLSGQLIFLDAEETLAKFMVDGSPDKKTFETVIGSVVAKVGAGRDGVRAFGEMVALLWKDGNQSAAIQLEELWNDLSRTRPFLLLCAYPLHDFDGAAHGYAFSQICQEHSHVLPLENFARATLEPNERLREIALLQQKANSLEIELEARKRAEVAAKQLAAIVESSDDAIIFKDLNGIIQTWNKGAERIFGYNADEVIGKPVLILIPPEYRGEEPDILARLRRGERIDHYETIRQRKDGRRLNISLTVSPVKDDEGNIIGASKIARDITERKQIEQKLAAAFEREKSAGRMKDNFLAMLSHELRTPLNPVLLIASDAAQNPEVPPALRAQFETILKNVEVEVRLIDDLLDLSRINHDKLRLNVTKTDVHAVLQEAIEKVKDQMDSKRLRAIIHLGAESPVISADPVRLQQIFWNLLRNAVKFTPEGGTITVETASHGNAGLVVKITDTGIGMTAEELTRVFSPFAQGDHIAEKCVNYGGLGLGLTITKKLVELHSGQIQAASQGRGKGTVFTVEFPLRS